MKIILFWFLFFLQTLTVLKHYVPNAIGQRHHYMLMKVFCLVVRVVLMCAWINTASYCWPFKEYDVFLRVEKSDEGRKKCRTLCLYVHSIILEQAWGAETSSNACGANTFFSPLYKSISSDQHLTAALGVHGFSMAQNWMSGEAWQEQVKGLLTFLELRAALCGVSTVLLMLCYVVICNLCRLSGKDRIWWPYGSLLGLV